MFRRFNRVTLVGGEAVQRDWLLAASALEGSRFVALLGQPPFQRQKQKRPETSLGFLGRCQVILRQARGEKTLHRILCIVRGVAHPAQERVEGIPVSLAKLLQSRPSTDGVAASGREHDTPMCSGEAFITLDG